MECLESSYGSYGCVSLFGKNNSTFMFKQSLLGLTDKVDGDMADSASVFRSAVRFVDGCSSSTKQPFTPDGSSTFSNLSRLATADNDL